MCIMIQMLLQIGFLRQQGYFGELARQRDLLYTAIHACTDTFKIACFWIQGLKFAVRFVVKWWSQWFRFELKVIVRIRTVIMEVCSVTRSIAKVGWTHTEYEIVWYSSWFKSICFTICCFRWYRNWYWEPSCTDVAHHTRRAFDKSLVVTSLWPWTGQTTAPLHRHAAYDDGCVHENAGAQKS